MKRLRLIIAVCACKAGIAVSKLLGKTDLQGQLNQIDLTTNFLDAQIAKAR